MEKLTYNQQDKLEHLYTLMEYAGLIDSVQKASDFLIQFGEYESRYYELDYNAIAEYVLTRMKKLWLCVYCYEADKKYYHLTTKEQRDAAGYTCDYWKDNIDIEYFDTLQEVKEQAIKDAITKARLNQKEQAIKDAINKALFNQKEKESKK